VEGALPNLLQDLTEAVGASRFETPVAGRDAQLALRNAMEAWSREVHIGRWGAALFFYALGHFTGGNVRDSPLNLAIEELSREKVASLTSGAKVAVEDWGVAGFLSEVGRQAMGRAACEEAIPLLRAAVNLYENYHRWLSDSGHEGSFPERQMNLATSWGNYAQALLMTGKFKVALAAFTRSLQHAYLGGHSDSFLIGITNILHYGSGFKEVRRCMRIVDAGIRTADRLGSVQSSIELRLLLAGYHIDRNEIWAGADVLKEAGRRAVAVHDRNVLFVRIMEGHLLLKQGRIQEGLTAIADTVSAVPHAAFVHYPTDEVRKHLDLLGIEQKGPFIIELVHDQIPDLVKKIEQEVADAKANKQLPWQGRHCSVSESSGLGQDYMRLLFELGVAEFEGNTKKAIRLGLNLAEIMLESRYSHDARWAAINVLANPAALAEHRGPAHSLLAQANAELGYIEEVVADLRQAVQDFEKAGQTIPLRTLETGMWHAIQSLEGKAAAHWAAMLGAALSGEPERDARCADVAAKIDTWGQPMAEVGDAFRRAASSAGINLPTATVAAEGQRPFRRFVGVTAEVRGASDEQVDAMLREAQNALAENDPDRALALLDGLASRDLAEVPEHQAGIALALQIQGLSAKAAPAELDLAMDRQRERLVAELAFSALTRLETSMVWAAIFHGEPALAADILAKHSFVAEFSVDPLARVSLFAWEAQFAYLRNQALRSKRAHFASVAAHYFGTAETQFLRAAAAPDSEEALPRLPSTPGEGPAPGRALSGADTIRAITKEFLQTLDEADESSGADAAMTTAVRALRRRRLLTPWVLANLRDRRAGWALQARRLDEAVQLYRKAARTFRLAKENEGVLNAMAGEARALSRSGDYGSAVQVFERALVEAKDLPVRSTLLLGLASAHLMEATERHGEIDPVLTDKAVATYREAIKTTPLDARERPLARLGLARALGQKGEQVAALAELDQAVAELAHLGSPSAKILLENRKTFERGEWRALGLY
jgi:tetratricopeptide (TPR) repeat protein